VLRATPDPVGTSGRGRAPAQPPDVLRQFQLLDLLQKIPSAGFITIYFSRSVAVAERSKAATVFARWDTSRSR
jgi:hypothetical protein